MPSILCQTLQIARQIIATDHIEDGINPGAACDPLNFSDEIGGFVIDRMIRTDLDRTRAFLIRSTSHDHDQPK